MSGLVIVSLAAALLSLALVGWDHLVSRQGKRPAAAQRFQQTAEVRVMEGGSERVFLLGPNTVRLQGRRLSSLLVGEMGLSPENAAIVVRDLEAMRSGGAEHSDSGAARKAPWKSGVVTPRERFPFQRVLRAAGATGSRAATSFMTSSDGRVRVELSSRRRNEIILVVEDREYAGDEIAVLNVEHDGDWHRYLVPLSGDADRPSGSGVIVLPTAAPTVFLDYDIELLSHDQVHDEPVELVTASVRVAAERTEFRWQQVADELQTPEDAQVQQAIRRTLRELEGLE